MKNILVTGFQPFDNDPINPSEELCMFLSEEGFKTSILPVTFNCFSVLKSEIATHSPDIVICTGLAGIRKEITIERIAINLLDARIPDNEGNQPKNQLIQESGSDGIFTNLPLDILDFEISNSAGTYVCNYVMYELLHNFKDQLQGGFIHLPLTKELDEEKAKYTQDEVNQMFLEKLKKL
jgi:pyroglutamyl-peptidase